MKQCSMHFMVDKGTKRKKDFKYSKWLRFLSFLILNIELLRFVSAWWIKRYVMLCYVNLCISQFLSSDLNGSALFCLLTFALS